MKIKFLFLLFLLSTTTLIAQNFSGKVIDANTKLPIPYIVVKVSDSEKYQITNDFGVFTFNFSDVNNKTLIFENTYYVTQNVLVTSQTEIQVELQPNTVTLEEVVVVNKPYSEIFEDIFNAKSNAIDKQVKLETYYTESVYDNETLTKTADGLVDFYIIDKKKDFVNAKIKESRIRTVPKDSSVISKTESLSVEAKPNDIVETAIQMSKVKKLGKNKKYEFHTTAFYIGDKQMQTVYFTPKPNESDDVMITGKIVYDAETKKIEEFSYKLVKSQSKYAQKFKSVMLIAKLKINDINIQANYAIINGFNVVKYASYHLNMDIKIFGKDVKFNNKLSVYSYNMDILDTKKYDKDYFDNVSLFKFGNHNNSNFWEKEPFKNWEIKL